MKKFLIYGAFALLSVAAVSCNGDDPLAPGTGAPTIQVTPNTISGRVVDQNGNPIEGATVTLGDQTVTTNANGEYVFENVQPGEHTVTVTANGHTSSASSVDIESNDRTQNGTASFTLYTEKKSQNLNLTSADATEQSTSVETAYSKGNEKAEVEVTVEVEPGTVDEDLEVWVTPIYTEYTAETAEGRAFTEYMLVGATLHSSKPVTLKKDVTLSFDLDDSVLAVADAKKLNNGTWSATPFEKENGQIIIKTREFTSFSIYAPLEIVETTAVRALTFNRDLYDNRDNSSPMAVGESTYTYDSGIELKTTAANKLQALMIEVLNRDYGFGVTSLTGTYPLNTEIAGGWAIKLYGQQTVYNLTCKTSNNTTVSATRYGAAEVWNAIWNADHNGGGSH